MGKAFEIFKVYMVKLSFGLIVGFHVGLLGGGGVLLVEYTVHVLWIILTRRVNNNCKIIIIFNRIGYWVLLFQQQFLVK